MKTQILFKPFEKQQMFMDKIFDPDYMYLGYGGAVKGGKTTVCLATILLLSKIYAGSRWAIVRKDLPTLVTNTLPVFEKIRPAKFCSEINKQRWEFSCNNGSKILFFPESYKSDPDLMRWRGLDVNGIYLEEANELREETWYKSIERKGSWVIPNLPESKQPKPIILLSFNPGSKWVKRVFYDPYRAGTLKQPYFFLPANIYDNPFMSQNYVDSLSDLPDILYRQYVKGEWIQTDEPMQVILIESVYNAIQSKRKIGRQRLGIDVGYTGDRTIGAHFSGLTLTELVVRENVNTTNNGLFFGNYIATNGIDPECVGVDTVGIGAGVYDTLQDNGFDVKSIVGGGKVRKIPGWDTSFKFRNLRAQMYWWAREQLKNGKVSIRIKDKKLLQFLIEDLTAIRFKISGDKVIQIESKQDIIKRLGRSPDFADAFVYGLFVNFIKTPQFFSAAV